MGDALALAAVAVPREWADEKEVLRRVQHYGRIHRSDHATARGLLQQMLVHGLVELRSAGVFKGDQYRLAERVQRETPVEEPKDRTVYAEILDPETNRVNRFVHGSPEEAAEGERVREIYRAGARRQLGL